MIKNYSALGERMEMRTLDNGLRVCYLPKEGFSKTFAILATDFGSVDASFTFEGKRYDTPAGVAHFLEHKMFEDKDGNALQKFARTGASPNAFTSHTMTAYHFSCTDRFAENLEILLKFVFTPYFTEENVAKERGIIGQEIGMMDDTPGWQAMVGLYEGLYREHPVRVSIAGSVESIAAITPETLYTCHRAFYSPKNMALVVCGTADFEEICRMAAQFSPQDAPEIGERHYGTRREAVNELLVTRKMQVSHPQFLIGFKEDPVQPENPNPSGGESVVVYVPDEQGETLTPVGADAADDSDQALVDALITAGSLPEGVAVNSSSTADGVLTLDMNAAYGEAVRSSGTTGENMLIYSLVNTFVQARGVDSVIITVDGAPLESGHEIYDYPLQATN